MEDALIEVPTLQRFAGIDLISDLFPDYPTILAFLYLLEKHELGKHIFETVKAHLKQQGMAMKQVTIIETTFTAPKRALLHSCVYLWSSWPSASVGLGPQIELSVPAAPGSGFLHPG